MQSSLFHEADICRVLVLQIKGLIFNPTFPERKNFIHLTLVFIVMFAQSIACVGK